jgi:hypothetical protein
MEPDPATRFRMLFAAAWMEPHQFWRESYPGRFERLQDELQKCAATSSAHGRKDLEAFVDRLRTEALAGNGNTWWLGTQLSFATVAMNALHR